MLDDGAWDCPISHKFQCSSCPTGTVHTKAFFHRGTTAGVCQWPPSVYTKAAKCLKVLDSPALPTAAFASSPKCLSPVKVINTSIYINRMADDWMELTGQGHNNWQEVEIAQVTALLGNVCVAPPSFPYS